MEIHWAPLAILAVFAIVFGVPVFFAMRWYYTRKLDRGARKPVGVAGLLSAGDTLDGADLFRMVQVPGELHRRDSVLRPACGDLSRD